METDTHQSKDRELTLSEKILIFFLFEAPLMYLLILYILQTPEGIAYSLGFDLPSSLILLTIFSMIGAIFLVFLSNTVLLTFLRKSPDFSMLFTRIILVITCGAELISLLGMIIGIIGYMEYDTIYWIAAYPFILFGMLHGIYLYFVKIKPILREFSVKAKSDSILY